MKAVHLAALLLAVVTGLAGVASAASYSLTVQTDAASYAGAATVRVSGQVSPPPGPDTAVYLRVFNPNHDLVTAREASVNGTSGAYDAIFVAGGTSAWTNGTYVVNATWGAYGPVVFVTTTFNWSSGTSSTTSSTTSASTSTAPSTSSTVHSTSSVASSATTSSVASSASTSSATTFSTSSSASSSPSTSSTVTSSSTASSAGSIPEFPFQVFTLALLIILVVGSYLFVKRRSNSTGPKGNFLAQ